MEQKGWKDVLETLRSSIILDECASTIELSYNHLPDHLKPFFLWFGSFPQAHEFSVKKLIWLWIAEGLVRKCEAKCLEDVAADYLRNLIGRSLVMNIRGRAVGGVKACRIHDLLHQFCLRKAQEDYFLHQIKVKGNGEQEHISFDELQIPSFGEPDNLRRLCMYAKPHHLMNYEFFYPRMRSLLFFTPLGSELYIRYPDLSSICHIFKLLRVLDMERVYLRDWPSEVGLLVQLRYLAIQVSGNIYPALGKLSKLETLILHVVEGVVILSATLWNLRKLRHVYSIHGSIELSIDDSDSSCNLLELDTVSTLCVRDLGVMEKQMRMFPNIRQMKCELMCGCVNDNSKVLDFSSLSQLDSLSLSIINHGPELLDLIFPENIKKLTLSVAFSLCNIIASIAKLPNLEVLKLLEMSFYENTWHVEEGEFPELKYLKLQSTMLVKWTAASDELFPNLEKLVVEDCHHLEEILDYLENVATLEMIDVIDCPVRVVSLVKRIEEFQKEMGNSVQFHERRTLG